MKKIVLSSLLAIAAAAPIASQAADGTITFNGSVIAQTCTINGGTPNLTVALPRVAASNFTAVGSTVGASNSSIKISLTACPAALTAARAFFENGATVNSTTRRLINSGTATNLEVGLTTPQGVDIAVGAAAGAQNTASVPIVSGAADLVYGTKYVSTATTVGAGTVVTNVAYTIDYQ